MSKVTTLETKQNNLVIKARKQDDEIDTDTPVIRKRDFDALAAKAKTIMKNMDNEIINEKKEKHIYKSIVDKLSNELDECHNKINEQDVIIQTYKKKSNKNHVYDKVDLEFIEDINKRREYIDNESKKGVEEEAEKRYKAIINKYKK